MRGSRSESLWIKHILPLNKRSKQKIKSSFGHLPLFKTLWTVACQSPLPMGFLQASVLKWFAMPSSRGSSQPRDQTYISYVSSPALACRFFTASVTWRKHIKSSVLKGNGQFTRASQVVVVVKKKKKKTTCQYRRYKSCGFNLWVKKIPWRRAWQPTLVFLPAESHWQRSLAGYRPIGSHRVRPDWNSLAWMHIRIPHSLFLLDHIYCFEKISHDQSTRS